MRETKISIVVPVYNAEKELQRCVDSIFRQSFSNWELLLIDDGSRDSSSALCDRLGAQDTRVRVWHKENGGVSSARNLGICKAEGEYLFLRTVMIPCSRIPWQLYIKRQKYLARIFRCAVLHIWWNRRKNVWITFRKSFLRWRKRISGGAVFIGLPAGIFQSAME